MYGNFHTFTIIIVIVATDIYAADAAVAVVNVK